MTRRLPNEVPVLEAAVAAPEPEWVDLSLSREQVWMIYDLVSARAETISAKELEAMQGLGGAPWTRLCARLRSALEAGRG